MPTKGIRSEDKLIDLFLSAYEDGSWAGSLSGRFSPERETDGGVEMIATRHRDRLTLAIEHTLIEPFPGEKSDFHNHFKKLQEQLANDPSLRLPGFAIYLQAPIRTLPPKSKAQEIIDEVAKWLRASRQTFTDRYEQVTCPCPSHPDGGVKFYVQSVPLGDATKEGLAVQRYGDMKLPESITKALKAKLPKLVGTKARRRLLMLERDQGWLPPKDIYREIARQRRRFPRLTAVDEIWIADTATFGAKGDWVEFSLDRNRKTVESFAFYCGELHSRSKNNLPIPIPARQP